jgi:hypothetical protein
MLQNVPDFTYKVKLALNNQLYVLVNPSEGAMGGRRDKENDRE